MRQWRVGTLTMGILLIFCGIALLYAHINQVTIVDFFVQWWPAFFILLGIEVLVYSLLFKATEDRIKYDLFSIFIIFVILFSGLAVQAIHEVNLLERIRQEIGAQNYELKSEPTCLEVEADIEKIVVEAPTRELLVRSNSARNVTAYAAAVVNADTQDHAAQILNENFSCKSSRLGNTLFLHFNSLVSQGGLGYSVNAQHYTVILPEGVDVEIITRHAPVDIDARIISDWTINADSTVTVRLQPSPDLFITAIANHSQNLQGNIDWVMEETGTDKEQSSADAPITADNSFKTQARYQAGAALHHLQVISTSNIQVISSE